VELDGTSEGTFDTLDFSNAGNVKFSSPGGGTGVYALEGNVEVGASLELVQGAVDLTGVSKLTLEGGTLAGTADNATYTLPAYEGGPSSTLPLPGDVTVPASTWTPILSASPPGAGYLFAGNVTLSSDSGEVVNGVVDLFNGLETFCAVPFTIPIAGVVAVALPPCNVSVASGDVIALRAYTQGVVATALQVSPLSPGHATWLTVQQTGASLALGWCYEWDFTVDAGVWSAYSPGHSGAEEVGTGWVSGYYTVESPPGMDASVTYTPASMYIARMEVDYYTIAAAGSASRFVYVTTTAGEASLNLPTGANSDLQTATLNVNALTSGDMGVVLRSNGNVANNIIAAIRLYGTGTCPFGTPNC
jgi:hypothetical protein